MDAETDAASRQALGREAAIGTAYDEEMVRMNASVRQPAGPVRRTVKPREVLSRQFAACGQVLVEPFEFYP